MDPKDTHRAAGRKALWLITILLAVTVSLAVSAGGSMLWGSDTDAPAIAEAEAAEKGETPEDEEGEEAAGAGGEEGEEEESGLTITAIAFHPNRIVMTVENGGDEDCEIGIVMVDEAIGPYEVLDGSRKVEAGGKRTLSVSYQWVAGDPYEFGVVDDEGRIAEAETVAAEGEAALEGGEEEEE